MKSSFLKKLLSAALASVFLVSAGAAIAAEQKCPKGEKWDPVKKECVKEVKK